MLVVLLIEVVNFGLKEQCRKQNINRIVSDELLLIFVFFFQYNNLFLIDFLRCCGSCPFASLLAFLLTLTGTGICCGCLYYSLESTIIQINNVFQVEYINHEW